MQRLIIIKKNIWIFVTIKIKHMRSIFFLLLSASILFTSCDMIHGERIKGSGNVITQARNVSGFDAIDASGAVNVFVKQDSAYSVKVEIDDNLQEYVIVEEENGILRVHQANNTRLQTTGDIKIYVSLPAIKEIQVSGASRLIGENTFAGDQFSADLSGASHAELKLDYPKVNAELTGASSVNFSGKTKEVDFSGSGASHFRCFDLLSETARVDLSGASDAQVFASVRLDAEASGASGVKYRGEATANTNVSGASHVSKAE